MRRLLSAAMILLTLSSGAAFAQDVFTSNTIRTVSQSDQSVLNWVFNGDGTYAVTDAQGHVQRGTYTANETQFCRTPSGGQPICSPRAPANLQVGGSWTFTDSSGATYAATIVAGRS